MLADEPVGSAASPTPGIAAVAGDRRRDARSAKRQHRVHGNRDDERRDPGDATADRSATAGPRPPLVAERLQQGRQPQQDHEEHWQQQGRDHSPCQQAPETVARHVTTAGCRCSAGWSMFGGMEHVRRDGAGWRVLATDGRSR
jgi:hypothetical protein